MERSLFRYIIHHTWRDQILLLVVTAVSFPLIYINLEIPKRIVNNAIGGKNIPATFLGFDVTPDLVPDGAVVPAARADHDQRRDQVLAQRVPRHRRRAHDAAPAARSLREGAALPAAAVQDDVGRRDHPDDRLRDRAHRQFHRRVDQPAGLPGRPAAHLPGLHLQPESVAGPRCGRALSAAGLPDSAAAAQDQRAVEGARADRARAVGSHRRIGGRLGRDPRQRHVPPGDAPTSATAWERSSASASTSTSASSSSSSSTISWRRSRRSSSTRSAATS